ncbi:MAG: hypothetical protein RLZZ292_1967 [Bacteroidota bacterium]|jgi:tetratricopeptide (TPR) repeat protein
MSLAKYTEIQEQLRQNTKAKGLFLTNEEIEAYARGTLDAATAAILETRVENDSEFALAVTAEKAMQESLRSYVKDKKENNIVAMPTRRFHLPSTYRWAAAASVLFCILGVGWFYITKSNPLDMNVVLAAEKNALTTVRGYDSTPFETIKLDVKAAQYQKALDALAKMPPYERDEEVQFLEGFCYQYLKDNTKAISIFEQLVNNPNSNIAVKEQAQYHLAMSYMVAGANSKAIGLLENLRNVKESAYQQKAKDLLEKLK